MNFATDYGRSPRAVVASGAVWTSWIVPVALAVAVLLVYRRAPLLALAACLFIVPLLPVLGIVPFDFQEYSTVADHYLYLSMLGAALAGAVALIHVHRQAGMAIGAGVIVALGIGTFLQAQRWHDTASLMRHTVSLNPRAWMALNNLAAVEVQQGRWSEAEAHARQSIAVRPNFEQSHYHLGCVLLERNDPAGAAEQFERAIAIRPELVEAHMNLGLAYGRLGRVDAAVREFQTAAKLNPRYAPAQQILQQMRESGGGH
jgi:tetratricopeptide (TPR) repeat protein